MVLTEPPHNLTTLQANCDEIVLEEYKFSSYIRCVPAALIPWGKLGHLTGPGKPPCQEVVLLVDSGFSFTHITPVVNGEPVQYDAKRLNIGGKLLTNVLKEMISFRQYNMMEETQLINQIKEECCYVTDDFNRDMELARRGELSKNFVLPDFSNNTPGYLANAETTITEEMQILTLKYELFSVPELLFRPLDVGLNQCGIVEGVMEAIRDLSEPVRALCLANIVLVGGNTKFPGFRARFEKDLRALAPSDFELGIYLPDDPITYTCQAGLAMAKHDQHVRETSVTRAEYLESNKKASLKFNRSIGSLSTGHSTPDVAGPKRRESKYDETSDRADTPRSFSPDTEPEGDEPPDVNMTDE